MPAFFIVRLINVGLRGLTMVSRFALVIVLARLLSPAEVGTYGLFAATVGFSMLAIGGEYYNHSQRELLSEPRSRWSFVLQHQVIAALLLYTVLLPAQFCIFVFGLLPWPLAGWFFVLLIGEHLAQEINRLLIAMQRQLLASAVLFLRMGMWIWALLPLMWLKPSYRYIEIVFSGWLLGLILAVILGVFAVWREARPWRYWLLDWSWLRRGFAVSFFYMIATLSFRALQTFDRYAVEFLTDKDLLGVYVLYTGMAMAVISVIDSGVFFFLYPKLVAARRQGDIAIWDKLMRELAWSALAVGLGVVLLIGLLAPWISTWIGKPLYAAHINLLWMLLMMALLYAMAMVPHYGLYSIGLDKVIVHANLSALIVFFATLAAAASMFPAEATPLALIFAFIWMGIYKYWALRKHNRITLTSARP